LSDEEYDPLRDSDKEKHVGEEVEVSSNDMGASEATPPRHDLVNLVEAIRCLDPTWQTSNPHNKSLLSFLLSITSSCWC